MDGPRKHQVSLRGASAKEITRDALLERVSQERELRNYTRRATAAALFIQRVWRRYYAMKIEASKFQEEWEMMFDPHDLSITKSWISSSFLRPFLFFVTCLSTRCQKIRTRDVQCVRTCFRILLESMNSTDPAKSFCSLAIGTQDERRIWIYQSRKLISLCLFILGACDDSHQDIVALTSQAMRLAVVLTDVKGWKCIADDDLNDADIAITDLIDFMGSEKSGLYLHVRRYFEKLDASFSLIESPSTTEDQLLITASALTLALRPIHRANTNDPSDLAGHNAAELYCVFVLTIPWLAQRLPAPLLPALQHKSILSICFRTLMVMADPERENFKGDFRGGSGEVQLSVQHDAPSWLASCKCSLLFNSDWQLWDSWKLHSRPRLRFLCPGCHHPFRELTNLVG